jgi:hypothetical protein
MEPNAGGTPLTENQDLAPLVERLGEQANKLKEFL